MNIEFVLYDTIKNGPRSSSISLKTPSFVMFCLKHAGLIQHVMFYMMFLRIPTPFVPLKLQLKLTTLRMASKKPYGDWNKVFREEMDREPFLATDHDLVVPKVGRGELFHSRCELGAWGRGELRDKWKQFVPQHLIVFLRY